MRIIIVGPGALGSLLAARIFLFLREQGNSGADNDEHRLYLLDHRAARAQLLNEHGLRLQENGRTIVCRLRVTADPEVIGHCDVLFLCVKALAVASALAGIFPLLAPQTLLIAMQNGIGHLAILARSPCSTAAGITSEGATLLGPGHVRHCGSGITRLGLLLAGHDVALPRLQEITRLLNAAGLPAEITRHPLRHIWAKLFVNVGINALSAIYRRTNGQLLTSESIREQMQKAVNEAVAIARAQDIPIIDDPVTATFKVCRTTRNNVSSMLQDVLHQRPTEIDAINGAVVAAGEQLGIATPVNRELVRQIKVIEATYGRSDSGQGNDS
ncbi:MAG: 2-dehydropantoate 2-reductase [Proteobacteria bacterium]|nr:2-dehydropantoate 2-reductase [Pseudomonadota bacterium]